MPDTIGVAIVGYRFGRIMHRHLIRAASGYEIRAIVTNNEERRRQAHVDEPQAKLCGSMNQALKRRDIDLVVIVTPHDTHHELVLAALHAGKHVVVDKIMALSVREADDMIATAEKNERLLTVFHNRRWDSDFLTVQHAIELGALGDIYRVESVVDRHHTTPPFGPPPDPLPWRMSKARGGGPFRDWGAHLMDQAILIGGDQVEVVCCDMMFCNPAVDVESYVSCHLRFASGLRYVVETGNLTRIPRPRWHVCGSEGTLQIDGLDPQEDALKQDRVISGKGRMLDDEVILDTTVEVSNFSIQPGNWVAFYENVRDTIHGQAELAVTPQQCRRVLEVYEEAFRKAGYRP